MFLHDLDLVLSHVFFVCAVAVVVCFELGSVTAKAAVCEESAPTLVGSKVLRICKSIEQCFNKFNNH